MADYYDCKAADVMTCTEIDEAVQEYFEYLDPPDWPKEVEVKAFVRKEVSERERRNLAEQALEELIERLDEEYGNPEEATEFDDVARAVAREFVDKIIANYEIWGCEESTKENLQVNTAEWVRKNNPLWLEEADILKRIEELEKE